jgi:hypothetical protein
MPHNSVLVSAESRHRPIDLIQKAGTLTGDLASGKQEINRSTRRGREMMFSPTSIIC